MQHYYPAFLIFVSYTGLFECCLTHSSLMLDCLNAVLPIRHLYWIVWMLSYPFITYAGLFECCLSHLSLMLDCLNAVSPIRHLYWIVWMLSYPFVTYAGLFECCLTHSSLMLDCLNAIFPIRCFWWIVWMPFITHVGLFEYNLACSSLMLDCLNVLPSIHRLSSISFTHFPLMCFLYRMIALQSYPDENHSLRSVLLHVYTSMDQFWAQCFGLDNFPA
jgi:flagellar biosynthesis regulator FlbT